MGTEIWFSHNKFTDILFKLVKLNNPLMGTEMLSSTSQV